jgi:signal transduction histidine kinase/ActR/RegA family two-component response regulator
MSRLRAGWRSRAGLIGVVLLLAAGLFVGLLNEGIYRARRAQHLQAQADVLAATVAPALVFEDPAAARELVGALAANEEIEAAAVYARSGPAVARYALNRAILPEVVPPGSGRFEKGRFITTAAVTFEGEPIGTVYIRTTREAAGASVGRHGGVALLAIMAALAAAIYAAAQRALHGANAETEARAADLARANAELTDQIARREKAEEALHQTQKMEAIGQLTGGIAHDFNNLLQGVSGSLDLIRRRPEQADRVRLWAERGFEAAERGAKLTAQLLAFSRSQKLELRPTEPAQVVSGMRDLLETTMGAKIELRLDLRSEGELVLADPTQLELAILNMAINARDAMPNGGRLTISIELLEVAGDPELPDGPYVAVAVQDTGVGMPADVRARAFDPFFTTKGTGRGTGLGLAQVYGIAKQAGGAARIESEPDSGTVIRLWLPRATGRLEPLGGGRLDQASNLAGASILLVDDDPGVRAYVTDALEALGVSVQTSEDGEEGLTALRNRRPDLLILDFAMPGLSGAEVAARARELAPDLPIIFASGYAETAALEKAVSSPIVLLRKPFNSAQLTAAIHAALMENARRPEV